MSEHEGALPGRTCTVCHREIRPYEWHGESHCANLGPGMVYTFGTSRLTLHEMGIAVMWEKRVTATRR
jgi:hypothetical protein